MGVVVLSVLAALLAGALYFVYDAKLSVEKDMENARMEALREKKRAETLLAALRDAVPWFVGAGEGGLAGDDLSGAAREVAKAIKRELATAVQETLPEGAVVNPDRIEEHLKSLGPDYSILKVVQQYKKRLLDLEARLKTQEDLLNEERKVAQGLREEMQKQNAHLSEQVSRLRAELKEARDEVHRAEQEKTRIETELKGALESERRGRFYDARDHTREIAEKESEIRSLKAEVARWKSGGDSLGGQTVEADGEVIDLDQASNIVVIDIGGRERVRPGMIFDVYWREKGGEPVWKGIVEVIDVQAGVSRCRIVRGEQTVRRGDKVERRAYNPQDPITPGCFVANPYFDPGRAASFVLLGEFRLHTTDELKKLITADGQSRIVDNVGDATFVVLGRPPRTPDPNYDRQLEEAKLRKIEVMTEEDLIRYLRNYRQDEEILLFSKDVRR